MTKSPYSNIKLSQLRALQAVAECGNFGEAALQLGLTQPTVSHAIASLEDELGIILLIRGRSGTHLTPAGEQIIQHVQQILKLVNAVIQDTNAHKGLHGGQVRIATFRSAAAYILPPIVATFKQQYPDVSVTLTEHYDYSYVEQEVRDGKADIGITFLPTSPEFESIELLRDAYLVLLPPGVDIVETRLSWKQLLSLPLIILPSDNSCFMNVQTYFREAGFDLKPSYQFREASTILSMVEQGLGAAILPQLSALSVPDGIKICHLPTPLERTIGAIVLAEALHLPGVFAFRAALEKSSAVAFQYPYQGLVS